MSFSILKTPLAVTTQRPSAVTSVGFDSTGTIALANGATADASDTGFLNFRVLTPGGSFTSLSGADYTTLQDGIGGVPEPATWAEMLLGFAGLGALLRRRRAPPVLA